ncbi:MAG: hypothetical protein R6V49_04025 [Bacteroidales bacterium]
MDKELLFLLIIIVTVVINIFKAVNKKKGQQSTPAAPPVNQGSGEEDWQEVLKKMFGDKGVQQPIESEQWNEAESLETLEPMGGSAEEVATYDFQNPKYSQSSLTMMEGFDVTPSTWTDEDDLTQQPVAPKSPTHPIKESSSFDLKKAVIFNAILNRPYA